MSSFHVVSSVFITNVGASRVLVIKSLAITGKTTIVILNNS